MVAMIERIAHHCFVHRWRTLLAWIALLAALVAGGGQLAGEFADGGRLAGTDSDRAYELLRAFPRDPARWRATT